MPHRRLPRDHQPGQPPGGRRLGLGTADPAPLSRGRPLQDAYGAGSGRRLGLHPADRFRAARGDRGHGLRPHLYRPRSAHERGLREHPPFLRQPHQRVHQCGGRLHEPERAAFRRLPRPPAPPTANPPLSWASGGAVSPATPTGVRTTPWENSPSWAARAPRRGSTTSRQGAPTPSCGSGGRSERPWIL